MPAITVDGSPASQEACSQVADMFAHDGEKLKGASFFSCFRKLRTGCYCSQCGSPPSNSKSIGGAFNFLLNSHGFTMRNAESQRNSSHCCPVTLDADVSVQTAIALTAWSKACQMGDKESCAKMDAAKTAQAAALVK
jgi:hypothetical protein